MNIRNILILIIFFGALTSVNAQMENTTQMCSKHIVPPFVSDGQQYRALLNGEELAEFHATFYGGSTYRISACSGTAEGSLIFSIYDKERNLLYSNRDFQNSPYWDFQFNSTMDCIIEAELSKKEGSGFAILLIGFKQK